MCHDSSGGNTLRACHFCGVVMPHRPYHLRLQKEREEAACGRADQRRGPIPVPSVAQRRTLWLKNSTPPSSNLTRVDLRLVGQSGGAARRLGGSAARRFCSSTARHEGRHVVPRCRRAGRCRPRIGAGRRRYAPTCQAVREAFASRRRLPRRAGDWHRAPFDGNPERPHGPRWLHRPAC